MNQADKPPLGKKRWFCSYCENPSLWSESAASIKLHEYDFHASEIDRRREIALVNACEGIPTEALEAGVVADLLAALTTVLGLLSTIEVLGEWEVEDSHITQRAEERAKVDKAVDNARTAIARARPS